MKIKENYEKIKKNFQLSPVQIVLISYITLILIGSILLKLPVSTTKDISFLDALFTATSATTVTGLIVLDTPKDFTFFGQLIILLLIQIGGLGYMTMTTFFLLMLRKKASIKERMILAESLNYPGIAGVVKFLKRVFSIVIIIEIIGAFALLIDFIKDYPLEKAVYLSIFHSISAFNNAGFSLFSDNLMKYKSDIYLNFVIAILIIVGGIGFYVITELILYFKKEITRISTHTKIVIYFSLFLIIWGAISILISEFNHYKGLWSYNWSDRIIISLFTSVSSRTAGFNTIDFSILSESTLFIIIILMFIGASPGGTGGGVKTVTVSVVGLAILNYLKGKKDVNVFKRRINPNIIYKAMVILALAFLYNTLITLTIVRVEEKPFIASLFEVVSAFSTVGLSVGLPNGLSLSADFSPFGKMLIILTMIAGRVGILGFALALSGKQKESYIKYPEARIVL